jgi:hypothetical protein
MIHKYLGRGKKMADRLRRLGIVMTVIGVLFALGGIYAYTQVQAGYSSLQAFSEAQGVELFQMATIGQHVLHGTQTIILTETAEYNGETFDAGVYEVDVSGRYWTEFDRSHPLDGPARGQAWSGTVHGLFGELGVGTVTASTLQLGLGISVLIFGLGLTLSLLGVGMFWVGKGKEGDTYPVIMASSPKPEPATV